MMKIQILWYLLIKVFTTVNSLPPYEYVGCFVDVGGGERALDWHVDASDDNQTVERCIHTCDGVDAPYAGLEYRRECFCGHDFDLYGKGDESTCNEKCSGNAQQICGGGWRMSVYRLLKWTRFRRDPPVQNNQTRTGIRSTWSIYTGMEVMECAMECSKRECWSFFHDNDTGNCFTQTLPEFTPRRFVKANNFCSDC
ncbi:sialate:O-sulfotransferase 1-like [Ptychodera flava]|uniref:sialate:O-sulfotransferase 1-like n=1 Tax=Ptychodera flava TaxID=63121 RepID=UPI003969E132